VDALTVGRRRWGAAWRAAVGLAVCAAGPALAEDDRVVEEPSAAQAQADQQHLIDLGANFDANLFEQQGNGWVLRGGNGIQVQGRVRMIVNGRVVLGGGNAAGADDPDTYFAHLYSLYLRNLRACQIIVPNMRLVNSLPRRHDAMYQHCRHH